MVTKLVRNYEIKAQSKTELERIAELMDTEEYYKEEFRKYFHVWVQDNIGVFYFIKEKYFLSRNGITTVWRKCKRIKKFRTSNSEIKGVEKVQHFFYNISETYLKRRF